MNTTRVYSGVDMIRMAKLAREHPHLKPISLIKKFNEEFPPKTAEQMKQNLRKALDKIFQNQESEDSTK